MTPEEQYYYNSFGFSDPQASISRALYPRNRATDPIVRQILELRDEAAKDSYKLPGAMSLAIGHPGVLANQIKTQPHYENDMRRAKFLDGVAGMQDRNDYYMRRTGEQSAQVMNEAMGQAEQFVPRLRDAVERRDEIASPYLKRGAFAYGQPLRNAADWAQAFASTNINAGRMLGAGLGLHGSTPEHSSQLAQQAADDFSDSANRLMFGIPRAIAGKSDPMQDAWEAERKAEERRPVGDMSFILDNSHPVNSEIMPRLRGLPYELQAAQGLTSGDTLARPLLGDGLAGRGAALLIDGATDMLSVGPAAIRQLLRARSLSALAKPRHAADSIIRGQYLQGAGQIASELALPGALMGISEATRADLERKLQEGGR